MNQAVRQRARAIARSLGFYKAARYLRKRGVSLPFTKVILGLPVRECDLAIGGSIEIVEVQ